MSWLDANDVQIALEKWEQEDDHSNVDKFNRVPEEYRFQRFKLGLLHFQTQYLKEVKEKTIQIINDEILKSKKIVPKIFGVRVLKELKYSIQTYYVKTHHEYHVVGIDDGVVESNQMIDLGYEKYYQYYIGFIHMRVTMAKACDVEIDTLIKQINEKIKMMMEKKKRKILEIKEEYDEEEMKDYEEEKNKTKDVRKDRRAGEEAKDKDQAKYKNESPAKKQKVESPKLTMNEQSINMMKEKKAKGASKVEKNGNGKRKKIHIEMELDDEEKDEEEDEQIPAFRTHSWNRQKKKVELSKSIVIKKSELIKKINKIIEIGTTYKLKEINEYEKIGFVEKVMKGVPYEKFPAAKKESEILIKIPFLKAFGKTEDDEKSDSEKEEPRKSHLSVSKEELKEDESIDSEEIEIIEQVSSCPVNN